MNPLLPVIAKLRHIREQWNLSRADLAELVGTTEHQIIRWESRECAPTLPHLLNWANALGCNLGVEIRK